MSRRTDILSGIVVVAVCCALSVVSVRSQQAARSAAQSRLDDANEQAGEQATPDVSDVVAEADGKLQAFDVDRMRSDEELLRSILETMVTWDSSESYAAARESTSELGLPESTDLATLLMPTISSLDDMRSDNSFDPIDDLGLNSAYETSDLMLWSTDDESREYTYVGTLVATTRAGDDADSVRTTYLVRMSTLPGQTIVEASGTSTGLDASS